MRPRRRVTRRAALFIGAHILALLGVYVLVVSPLADVFKTRGEEIDAKTQLLTTSRETLARLEALAGKAAPIRDLSSFFMHANDGVGAAMLQTRLKTLVEPQGVMIASQRSTDSRSVGGLTMRSARIELSGTIGALANVARSIEASQAPALFLTAATVRISPSGAAAHSAAEPQLEAQVDVEAPFLAAGASP